MSTIIVSKPWICGIGYSLQCCIDSITYTFLGLQFHVDHYPLYRPFVVRFFCSSIILLPLFATISLCGCSSKLPISIVSNPRFSTTHNLLLYPTLGALENDIMKTTKLIKRHNENNKTNLKWGRVAFRYPSPSHHCNATHQFSAINQNKTGHEIAETNTRTSRLGIAEMKGLGLVRGNVPRIEASRLLRESIDHCFQMEVPIQHNNKTLKYWMKPSRQCWIILTEWTEGTRISSNCKWKSSNHITNS